MSQTLASDQYDVVIIGGGFYGCSIALFLREYYSRILILERENDLLLRASLVNQARVHNGYHYPRSYLTALRSYINFPRFVADFTDCVDSEFEKVYGIARNNSKVNAFQFRKTFSSIGAPISNAPKAIQALFNPRLVEAVFTVREYAFDAVKLRLMLQQKLAAAQIEIAYATGVKKIVAADDATITVQLDDQTEIRTEKVLNCTYACINELLAASQLPPLPMKYELAEIALIDPPAELKSLGVTLMDGPYFSTMPFPSRQLHSLSHVRYTPHDTWFYDETGRARPFTIPAAPHSNAIFMIKDAQRYLPGISAAQYVDSLYEIKTILLQNEVDDGRPILFRNHYGIKNHAIVMGGKIDNIYDILVKIQQSDWLPATARAVAA